MIKSAALKKKQKADAARKQTENSKPTLNTDHGTEPSQNEEDSKPVPTQESEQDAVGGPGDFGDGKLSKKQKLNQKKKRQRIEKKKRIQQEHIDDFGVDSQLMVQNDQSLLEMYKFDPNEFMDDSQLRLLIDKYDPAMI